MVLILKNSPNKSGIFLAIKIMPFSFLATSDCLSILKKCCSGPSETMIHQSKNISEPSGTFCDPSTLQAKARVPD